MYIDRFGVSERQATGRGRYATADIGWGLGQKLLVLVVSRITGSFLPPLGAHTLVDGGTSDFRRTTPLMSADIVETVLRLDRDAWSMVK